MYGPVFPYFAMSPRTQHRNIVVANDVCRGTLLGVRAATGVKPLTSPPWRAGLIRPEHVENYDFIYLRLHGIEGVDDTWFGEDQQGNLVSALDADNLEDVDLAGATVLVANCYGASSPLVRELYQAGAEAVIAGPGRNWALADVVVGTDKLAQWMLRAMKAGAGPRWALQMAKMRVALTSWRMADRDAMQFKLIEERSTT